MISAKVEKQDFRWPALQALARKMGARKNGTREGDTRLACLSHSTTQARFPYARTHAEKKVKFLPQPPKT